MRRDGYTRVRSGPTPGSQRENGTVASGMIWRTSVAVPDLNPRHERRAPKRRQPPRRRRLAPNPLPTVAMRRRAVLAAPAICFATFRPVARGARSRAARRAGRGFASAPCPSASVAPMADRDVDRRARYIEPVPDHGVGAALVEHRDDEMLLVRAPAATVAPDAEGAEGQAEEVTEHDGPWMVRVRRLHA